MAGPVRARRLTDVEGQKLQQIVRRGKHDSVRVPAGVDHHGVGLLVVDDALDHRLLDTERQGPYLLPEHFVLLSFPPLRSRNVGVRSDVLSPGAD
jgi:hypothetical protein